jgi:hypothetical protein
LPYIPKHSRPVVAQGGATNPGELNFELTLAIRAYLREAGELKYAQINEVVESLEWTKSTIRCQITGTPTHLRDTLFRITERYIERRSPKLFEEGYKAGAWKAEREAVGAIECCKLEFYRRVAAPYEDRKIKTNGDVY